MERFNSSSSADHIVLTKRQVSMMMASMLLFCLFVFMLGFFLGKRTLLDDYSSKVTQEALHDQIDFLLTTQSLQNSQDSMDADQGENPELVVEKIEIAPAMPMLEEIIIPTNFAHEQVVDDRVEKKTEKIEPVVQEATVSCDAVIHGKQYAQLVGFGTKKAAQAFVNRLKKHDVQVILKTVMSKTASGKQRTWYQAITSTFESCEQLQAQVAKIKRLEHIRDKDIKIVQVK